ncbi:MAG: DUF488 domain-containing protein [Candidatus Micrarchaeia archaeon]
MIKLKRVYDDFDITDGLRILVDRLWPRGIRRDSRNIDLWFKEIAPSDELRKWFAHEQGKWVLFEKKYFKELESNKSLEKFLDIIKANSNVTFIFSAKDREHNNAVALLDFLKKKGYA